MEYFLYDLDLLMSGDNLTICMDNIKEWRKKMELPRILDGNFVMGICTSITHSLYLYRTLGYIGTARYFVIASTPQEAEELIFNTPQSAIAYTELDLWD